MISSVNGRLHQEDEKRASKMENLKVANVLQHMLLNMMGCVCVFQFCDTFPASWRPLNRFC